MGKKFCQEERDEGERSIQIFNLDIELFDSLVEITSPSNVLVQNPFCGASPTL
jgi:hypothetical protein